MIRAEAQGNGAQHNKGWPDVISTRSTGLFSIGQVLGRRSAGRTRSCLAVVVP